MLPGVPGRVAVAQTRCRDRMRHGDLIAAMEPDARPRERLAARGAEQLTDGELLAIVLGPGTRGASALDVAAAVLRGVGGPAGLLRATPPSWPRIRASARCAPPLVRRRWSSGGGRSPAVPSAASGWPARPRSGRIFAAGWRRCRSRSSGRSALDVRHRVQSETLSGARLADRRGDSSARRLPPAHPAGDGRGHLLSQPPVGRSGPVARRRRADGAAARGRRPVRHPRARSRRRRVGRVRQPRRAQLEVAARSRLRLPPCVRPRSSLAPSSHGDALDRRARRSDCARVRGVPADARRWGWGSASRAWAIGDAGPAAEPLGDVAREGVHGRRSVRATRSRLSEHFLHASIVDNTSAFGIAGRRSTTPTTHQPSGGVDGHGHEGGLALSFPFGAVRVDRRHGEVLQALAGVDALDGNTGGVTFDVGATVRPAQVLSLAVVGTNLQRPPHQPAPPRASATAWR